MWAGYIALVNQQLAANGQQPIGFLNPTIYAQNVTSAYTTNFHDITTGTSGSYSAVTGYDLVTGWGSPNAGLMAALTGTTTQTPAFTISATSASVQAGSSGPSTVTTSVSGGFNSAVGLSYSAPSGISVTFNPTTIAAPGSGSSTATISVASGMSAGNYSITVTGTGGGITQSTTISLTVTAASQPAFTVSASPNAITVARRSSGSATITTSASGGFSSAISLSASGQGGAQTVTFSPGSITGSGSSTMKVTVGNSASLGTRTITITANGGGITHTTTVTLTVIR
jgi:hypothetical protein